MRQNRDIPTASRGPASIYSFNPSFAADLFFSSSFACLAQIPEARSTGSKQTLNGLFIFITRVVPKKSLREHRADLQINPALLYPGEPEVYRWIGKN